MKLLDVCQIDAFTRQAFDGNPAGVVVDAAGLSERQMQLIARELNNSETAFVLPAEADDHDVRVRFFTPTTEVPVCGHATVSAHFVLALERGATGGVLRQLTGAGVQRVEAIAEPDGRLRIAIHQNRPEFRPVLDDGLHAELAAALGVARDAFDPRCPAQFVCTGHGKLLVGLRSLAQLRALQPDPVRLMALGAKVGSKGFFVFVVDEGAEPGVLTHGRMFAPGVGISEDPVTGNANGPLGAYLVKHGLIGVNDGVARFVGAQRTSTGRGGHVGVEVRVQDGVPVAVRISGDAVVCFRTQLPVPALAAS